MNKKTLFCKETSPLPSPDFPEVPWPPAHVAATPTTPHTFPLWRGLCFLQRRLQILLRGSASFPLSSKCKPCTEPQSLNNALLSRTDPGVHRGPMHSPSPRTSRPRVFSVRSQESRCRPLDIPCKGRKEQENLLYVL